MNAPVEKKKETLVVSGPWPLKSEFPLDKLDTPVVQMYLKLSFLMWGFGMLCALLHVAAGLWCVIAGVNTRHPVEVELFSLRFSGAELGVLLILLSPIWIWLTKPKIEFVLDNPTPPTPPGPGAEDGKK